jgi:N6-adenosine-specific RNA methylase IME4
MENLKVDPEFEKLIPPLSEEERTGLEKSLREEGCRDAIIVWKGRGIVVDGHHRFRICQEHGIKFNVVEIDFADRDEVKEWIIQNQFARRNLTDYQRGLLALELEKLFAEAAKAQQGRRTDLLKNSSKSYTPMNTRRKVARIAGVSENTIQRIKLVREKATDVEKTRLSTPGSRQSIHKVYMRIRRDEIKVETPPFPNDKFTLIYADPPWKYEFTETENRAVENHYPTMTLEKLKTLPISNITENDSILFLWATVPKCYEAMELMKAWGYTYRTGFVWVKDKIGMGHYSRVQHELLLIGVKGNPPTPRPSNRPSSIISAPRTKHSEKPELVYGLIEKMYPSFKKIELFARKARPGWKVWGAEAPKNESRRVAQEPTDKRESLERSIPALKKPSGNRLWRRCNPEQGYPSRVTIAKERLSAN